MGHRGVLQGHKGWSSPQCPSANRWSSCATEWLLVVIWRRSLSRNRCSRLCLDRLRYSRYQLDSQRGGFRSNLNLRLSQRPVPMFPCFPLSGKGQGRYSRVHSEKALSSAHRQNRPPHSLVWSVPNLFPDLSVVRRRRSSHQGD